MIHRSLAVGLVAALLLAGCSRGAAPLAGTRVAQQAGAKGAVEDAWDTIGHATRDAEDALALKGRLAAVLQNPTDVLMQRSLNVIYQQATDRVMQSLDPAVDEQFGDGQMARSLSETPEVPNAQVQQYVQGIANRLATAMGSAPFKTHVILDDEENAANQSGHSMVVNFGLMASARDEAEVAGVIGHEMTHGLKRHVVKDVVRITLDQDFVQWVNEAEGVTPEDEAFVDGWTMLLTPDQQRDRDFVMGYLAGKVRPEVQHALVFRYNSYFAAQAFSRNEESEADVGGVKGLAAAKYDPNGLVSAFDRWNEFALIDPRYSDHPTSGDRVGFLRSVIADLKLTGTDRGADRLAAIKPLLVGLKKPQTAESVAGPRQITLGSNPWARPARKP